MGHRYLLIGSDKNKASVFLLATNLKVDTYKRARVNKTIMVKSVILNYDCYC